MKTVVGGQAAMRRWLALSFACLPLSIAACTVSSGSAPATGGSGNAGTGGTTGGSTSGGSSSGTSGLGAGTLGGSCGPGGSCATGLTCVTGFYGDQYCAPGCNTNSDCVAFGQTSYVINVPDTFTPLAGNPTPVAWKSSSDKNGTVDLSRGITCAPESATPGGPKYCQWACPDFAAINYDTGVCYCLPGYSLSADKTSCVFGTSANCSIFTYATATQRANLLSQYGIQTQNTVCDACNSDTSLADAVGCYSNTFFCNIDQNGLNGQCAEVLTTSQLDQCITAQTNFDCTCPQSCVESCTDPSTCPDCCTCTSTSSPPPKAACNGGTSSSGSSSGSGSGGTTSGATTSGGTTSGGRTSGGGSSGGGSGSSSGAPPAPDGGVHDAGSPASDAAFHPG